MQADDIRTLFDYSYWATHRLLAALEKLTPEQFVATVDAPHGSLQGILYHALHAEHFQRAWWQGNPMAGQRETFAVPATPAELREAWAADEGEMRAFLSSLTDQDLARGVSMEPRRRGSLPLGLLMQHNANHTMQHRTEAALLLTQAAHSPGDLDFLFYVLERGMAEG